MSSKADVSSIASQVVDCDTKPCANVGDLVSEGVYATFMEKFPQEYNEFETCLKSDQARLVCKAILAEGLNKSSPFFFQTCDDIRKKTQDNPMIGYNPLIYKSPFWFNSLGDIWRHASYKAPKTTPDSCKVIEEEARTCTTDGTKKNEYCLAMHRYAKICRAGVNCLDIQPKLIRCLAEHELVADDDYQTCVDDIKSFPLCQFK